MPLNVAMPLTSVTVNDPPCNAAVPVPRDTVTVVVLSVVMMLLNASVSITIGWAAKFTPAVAVLDGCVAISSLDAVFGLTTMLFDAIGVTPAKLLVKLRLIVSA